jgi:hypothetical protein
VFLTRATNRAILPLIWRDPPQPPRNRYKPPMPLPLVSNHPTGKASVAAPQDSHEAGMGSFIQFARRQHRPGPPTAPAGHQGGSAGSCPPGTPGEFYTAAGTCRVSSYLPPSRPAPASHWESARGTRPSTDRALRSVPGRSASSHQLLGLGHQLIDIPPLLLRLQDLPLGLLRGSPGLLLLLSLSHHHP